MVTIKNENAIIGEIYTATITKTYEDTLRGYLKTPEKIAAMKRGMINIPTYLTTDKEIDQFKENRLNADVLVVVYKVMSKDGDKIISEWFSKPLISGMTRTLLYLVKEYQNLPDDTNDWIGHNITCKVQPNGYLRIIH